MNISRFGFLLSNIKGGKMKKISDIFKIIDIENSTPDLEVLDIKFSKKKNAALITLNIDRKIDLQELTNIQQKIQNEYKLSELKIIPRVNHIIELGEEDIHNILKYYENSTVFLKDLFNNAEIKITNNEIDVIINVPNSKFLKLKKTDENLSKLIKDFYGTEYKINIIDNEKAEDNFKEIEKNKKIFANEITENNRTNDAVLKKATPEVKKSINNIILGKDIIKDTIVKIEDVSEEYDKISISGKIEKIEYKETKNGKTILIINVADNTSTICCKTFLNNKKAKDVEEQLQLGEYIKLNGKPVFDTYTKELGIMINSIVKDKAPTPRQDNSKEKRVELHAHTQMSAMDGVVSATSLVKQAIKWGHQAIAVTDHGVVQSFPEANFAATDKDGNSKIKIIYGVEGYLISDIDPTINYQDTFIVFDIETTGFNAGVDGITEIAAVKIKKGRIIDEFSTFVNPERHIPKEVQLLTNITDDIVESAPKVEQALKDFLEFVDNGIMVAHNARFDMSFIKYFAEKHGYKYPEHIIDTLSIARELFEEFENHKLGTLVEKLNINLVDAHRAINDAKATAELFLKMATLLEEKDIDIRKYIQSDFTEEMKDSVPYHIIILAKNYVGLKNLYKIISFSHIRYFHKKPRIPRSLINRYREGLIIGSACERGELFQSILNKTKNIEKIVKFYDYLEIQPLDNNRFYINNGMLSSTKDLQNINKEIIDLGIKFSKPVVATGDVHFLNPEDELYRRIIMSAQGYEDAEEQPPLYYRTTEEMLKEFDYLGKDIAKQVVITNTHKIANMIENIRPVVSGTYNPVIEGSDEEVERLTYLKAKEIYGDPLPEIVNSRIKKELTSIITNGFSVMYIIAQKLVKRSNDDGYLVGSRGSVGSSFVATMIGITEVNPLPAHYVCLNCKYSEFPDTTVTTGIDMQNKKCPICGKELKKDGMDIPFETFLGFKGDKIPDIDLNFSGEYQSKAHNYTETLFGRFKTFRAGTIATIADKTAYGFVKNYFEARNKNVLSPEINRIIKCCTGIKRTTGQHPGGIIIVPKDKEIYDFCPIQRPADDLRTKTITTHFDFHSIHDNLLKLDILGHDDPTVIKMLEDLTKVSAKSIKLDDPNIMKIFSSTEALGVTEEQIKSKVGTFAVPEFGTRFVRQMLIETKPTTFGELVKISGLSHGTNVWVGNAQKLIEDGKVTLSNAICTRDDIMIYLMSMGLEASLAFKIMEIVRKGQANKMLTDDMQNEMRKHNVPEWYIESCKKIKYMFPKAHAVAYVMMAYKIAYYKVYYPKEFYATYFTIKANIFNYDIMCKGKQKVKETLKEFTNLTVATQTEKDTITVLEVVNEMLERGITFLPIDLYKSHSIKFTIEDEGIRPPFAAIPNFGNINAENIIKARKDGKFSSVDNLITRAKLGKVGIELLDKCECVKGMPKSSQVSLFD